MTRMKNFRILIAIMIVTIVGLIPTAFAAVAFPQIAVTMINQEPDPVSPGSPFDVRFRIENEGGSPANNVDVRLVLSYPLSLYGTELNDKNIGTVSFSSELEDVGVVEKWTLFADPNAATGDYAVEFWYRIDNGAWTKSGDFDVTVRSQNAFLSINNIETSPVQIVPGATTQVSFVLDNLAQNDLKDITLQLDLEEAPFTPIGSGNEKIVTRIARGGSQKISFDLFTNAEAQSQVYKVPYTLSYRDSAGENFTRTGIVGLAISSKPQLSVYVESSEVQSAGQTGRVTIKLVNKGFGDIKFLDMRLTDGQKFELLSTPEIYVGQLDSDDYETADYTISVSSDADNNVNLPVVIDYRDGSGQLYRTSTNLSLRLYTADQLKQQNGGGPSTFWLFVIVIVIAIVGVFIYRKIRRSKKK